MPKVKLSAYKKGISSLGFGFWVGNHPINDPIIINPFQYISNLQKMTLKNARQRDEYYNWNRKTIFSKDVCCRGVWKLYIILERVKHHGKWVPKVNSDDSFNSSRICHLLESCWWLKITQDEFSRRIILLHILSEILM